MGGRVIIKEIQGFIAENHECGRLFSSLGQLKYLSLMKHATLMVGNSSSGIIEAPSFKLPVVNIGDRQKGRVRAKNVIDVNVCNRKNISEAIKTAVSEVFVASIRDVENPYGKGNMSRDIIEKLKNITLSNSLIQKGFCVIR